MGPGLDDPVEGGRILVVDDATPVRATVRRALESLGHTVTEAEDGFQAVEAIRRSVPDLVLMDLDMPHMDGFEAAQRIRHDLRCDVPIIMVTGHGSRDKRLSAVESGINDFIRKPFELRELKVRTEAQLRMKRSVDVIRSRLDKTEQVAMETAGRLRSALGNLDRAERQTEEAYLHAIRSLTVAAEYKDADTAAHLERISAYAVVLAEAVEVPAYEVSLIRQASPMHDIGKIGIPDAILSKPGALNPEERSVMEQHTIIGARILGASDVPLIQMGRIIARWHHERWDGNGYPDGLTGDEIPLPARICSVADYFDALTTTRVYRTAIPVDETLGMMEEQRGKHFDPTILDAFFGRIDEIRGIRTRAGDLGKGGTGNVDLGDGTAPGWALA